MMSMSDGDEGTFDSQSLGMEEYFNQDSNQNRQEGFEVNDNQAFVTQNDNGV